MTKSQTIPNSSQDITPDWLAGVFGAAGFSAQISTVDVEPIGTGQMASSLRVTPTYTASTDAPATVVVKIASNDPTSRLAGAGGPYLKEVRFYQQLASTLPVATPVSFWAEIDTTTNNFAIVLEDMRLAKQGDQIAGCGIDAVRVAAVNIAGLHAPRWCDETLAAIEWLTPSPAERLAGIAELKAIVQMVTPGFIDRYAARLDTSHIDLLQWFSDNLDTWLIDDDGPFALTHCDHRLDNLLFEPGNIDRPVTVVDWQTLAVRNPMADISYLLGTSVEADVRREIERDIVASYHQALVGLGVDDYDLDTCFADYCSQTPHSLLLTVLGSMLTVQTDRGDDMFMAMLHRSSHQIQDLW